MSSRSSATRYKNRSVFETQLPGPVHLRGDRTTRGWFYTLMASDHPVCAKSRTRSVPGQHPAEDGRKLSKPGPTCSSRSPLMETRRRCGPGSWPRRLPVVGPRVGTNTRRRWFAKPLLEYWNTVAFQAH